MATDTVATQQQLALGLGLTNEYHLACSFCYVTPRAWTASRLTRCNESSPRFHGGCAGRRRLHHELAKPDFYCPLVRRKSNPLTVTKASHRD
jgi:hypothetical protein